MMIQKKFETWEKAFKMARICAVIFSGTRYHVFKLEGWWRFERLEADETYLYAGTNVVHTYSDAMEVSYPKT